MKAAAAAVLFVAVCIVVSIVVWWFSSHLLNRFRRSQNHDKPRKTLQGTHLELGSLRLQRPQRAHTVPAPGRDDCLRQPFGEYLYPAPLRQNLGSFPRPLSHGNGDVPLPLQKSLTGLYPAPLGHDPIPQPIREFLVQAPVQNSTPVPNSWGSLREVPSELIYQVRELNGRFVQVGKLGRDI